MSTTSLTPATDPSSPTSATSTTTSSSATANPPSPPPGGPFGPNYAQKVLLQPYILVVLVLLVLVVGCKVLSVRRRRAMLRLREEAELAAIRLLPPEPKLWDLWVETDVRWEEVSSRGKGRPEKSVQEWSNITPLSVTESKKDHDQATPSLFKRASSRRPDWSSSRRVDIDTANYSQTCPTSSNTGTIIQVEVVIAMPSPDYPIYINAGKRHPTPPGELIYCVGSHRRFLDD